MTRSSWAAGSRAQLRARRAAAVQSVDVVSPGPATLATPTALPGEPDLPQNRFGTQGQGAPAAATGSFAGLPVLSPPTRNCPPEPVLTPVSGIAPYLASGGGDSLCDFAK